MEYISQKVAICSLLTVCPCYNRGITIYLAELIKLGM